MEQTFIMIKPDGVQRGLVGDIISRFEKKGFYLKGLKFINVDRPFAEKHYEDLSAKPFFSGLVDYIISGPVVAMIWEGKNVVLTGRKIIGATTQQNPPLEPSVVIMQLRLAGTENVNIFDAMKFGWLTGISFMEVTQQRVQGKRLLCGSLMALLTGRAAFTTGSMKFVI
ncbi:Nucleoside diphosphate kinase family protein [Prunus dulcis]|uniref:nucleoside-diphosphate kinase n=1 Tax=Prunus dulcis TaxID=3755 RepID=A0A4Y1QZR8_PRUDU|nr:Nucleoside diphosphate kinase family protein [Prunus dulcis]